MSLKTIRSPTVLASREIEREGPPTCEETGSDPAAAADSKMTWLSVECLCMPSSEESTRGQDGSAKTALVERLRQVDAEFRREMRVRGFDPDQDGNLALTAPLAKLYAEREQLREELESMFES